MRRKCTKLTCLSAALMLALLVGYAMFFDPFNTSFKAVEEALRYEARSKARPSSVGESLKVMSWNVKFAGGRIDFFFDCHGDRVHMTRQEVIKHLQQLASKINQVDPDILLLQEVDIDSKRCARVDMVQWLLDNTPLNYGVYASQWRASYIPRYRLGRVDSGSAILSRWPFDEAKRLALPLVKEQGWLTRYFYLKRNILRASAVVPGYEPGVMVLNIHTEPFASDGTKERQIQIMKGELDRLNTQGRLFLAGGDFNTVPPGSKQVGGFPDSVCKDTFVADDYSQEGHLLVDLYRDYRAAILLEEYQADNRPYFSHTTDKDGFWNRKLDYLFTNGRFVPGSGLTHQDSQSGEMETMPLSDHAPLTVRLRLDPVGGHPQ